jgi:two-component system sensor histidine kinase/response regulator
VDDNEINCLILRKLMTSCSAELGEAESGKPAPAAPPEACDTGPPFQLILLGMRMPGMNRLEIARRIHDVVQFPF